MQTFQLANIPGEHPLEKASRLVGGRSALALALGVTPAAIGNWKQRGVPIEHCYRIEKATFGAVTRRDLRPDDWHDIWPEMAPTLANNAQPATETVVTIHDAHHEASAAGGLAVCQLAGQGA